VNIRRLKEGVDPWVRLQLPKGVLVVLTFEEYATALYRGKMERRAHRRARHTQQTQATQEASALVWITQGEVTMPEMIAPPSAPMLTLDPDPTDDIHDPAVPEPLTQALQKPQERPQEPPAPPDWQQHESLLQGFLGLLQGRLKGWIEDEHKALQSARATCDLEHQRLCQALEAVTTLAQQAVTTSQHTNEHAQYSLADAFARLQERGVQLHHDPYTAKVTALSPQGFPITVHIAKHHVDELIGALPALMGWLAQEEYKPVG
jgi:hypothetical protein